MKKYLALLSLLCASCGTYPLSGGAYPPMGKSEQDKQIDLLTCQDKARMTSQTTEANARGFLLGLTIIGVAAEYDIQQKIARETYATCMTEKGYRVLPVAGAPPLPAQDRAKLEREMQDRMAENARAEERRKELQRSAPVATTPYAVMNASAQTAGVDFLAEARKAARILGCAPADARITGTQDANIIFRVTCDDASLLNLSCDPAGLCLKSR